MIRYYAILAAGEYVGLVKIENGSKAYFFHLKKKKFIRDDYYLRAEIDPGIDFWDISEEEAEEFIQDLLEEEEEEENEDSE